MARISENRYCAFCKIPRRIYTKKNIGWTNVLLSALASVVFMLVIWSGYDSRVFILFAINLAVAETFIQLRWRMSVTCPYCGFDPVLYKKDRSRLVKQVKERLELARQKPSIMLSKNNPLRNLPTRVEPNKLRPTNSKELSSS